MRISFKDPPARHPSYSGPVFNVSVCTLVRGYVYSSYAMAVDSREEQGVAKASEPTHAGGSNKHKCSSLAVGIEL